MLALVAVGVLLIFFFMLLAWIFRQPIKKPQNKINPTDPASPPSDICHCTGMAIDYVTAWAIAEIKVPMAIRVAANAIFLMISIINRE